MATADNIPARLLDEQDVAEMLNVSVAVIRRWRLSKQGPKFLKLGRAVHKYRLEDVLRWLESRPCGGEQLAEVR
jgi:predicted DNA-binding transcriptional regulator AlpA